MKEKRHCLFVFFNCYFELNGQKVSKAKTYSKVRQKYLLMKKLLGLNFLIFFRFLFYFNCDKISTLFHKYHLFSGTEFKTYIYYNSFSDINKKIQQ